MWAYILAHENAVPLWRSLMGPTKVFRARNSVPDSIRGAYGLTDTRNTTHGSGRPVLGWVLGKDWSSGRCEWWYFVRLCLLSVLGVNVNDLLTSADSTHTCPGVTKPDAFPDGFCPFLWNIAPTCSARLASLIFFFSLFSNRFTSISQQRNCLFLPRVQWTALVPAGRATSALWAGVLQRRGACPLYCQGWRKRVDLSYLGVWFAELGVAARHTVWVSPITRHRAVACFKSVGEGKT